MSKFDYGSVKNVTFTDDDKRLGYEVETTTCNLSLFISNNALCCEEFGANMVTEDGKNIEYKDIVGKKVVKVLPSNKHFRDGRCGDCGLSECKCASSMYPRVLMNLHLDDGTIVQIEVYNFQNGYYTHTVYLNWGPAEDKCEL